MNPTHVLRIFLPGQGLREYYFVDKDAAGKVFGELKRAVANTRATGGGIDEMKIIKFDALGDTRAILNVTQIGAVELQSLAGAREQLEFQLAFKRDAGL